MAEIVNLNRARKAAAQRAEAEQAERNRASHGRSLAERKAEAARQALLERALDGAKRE